MTFSMCACCICICCSLKTSIFSLSCVWCSFLIFRSSAFSRSLTLALSAKYSIASSPLLRWHFGLSSLSSADESRPGRIEFLYYLFPVFPVIPLCLYISWNFLYVKTASKDFMIFEKQLVWIIRIVKVSIKDKSILSTKQSKHEMIAKTISLIYIYW